MDKQILCRDRVRRINGSFAFIEHRFLRDGFWQSLSHHELLLYLFLVIVADRHGLSYYRYDKICTLLKISLNEYILARDALMAKDLIAFDGLLFQVLSLPENGPKPAPRPIREKAEMVARDPATIRQLITRSLGG
jgi:hypothetical protein